MLMNYFVLVLAALGFLHVSVASMDKNNDVQKQTYKVHMAKSQMPASFDDHTQWYDSSLKSVSDSAEMLYTYNTAVHGFSTRLTIEESQSLKSQPGVLAVFPETKHELHTTRTSHSLGLDNNPDLIHVNPISALNPGLICDMDVNDYLGFLCASNFSASDIHTVYKKNFKCDPTKKYRSGDLNYPSFSEAMQGTKTGQPSGGTTVLKYSRTLTNLGAPATYNVSE